MLFWGQGTVCKAVLKKEVGYSFMLRLNQTANQIRRPYKNDQ